MSPPWFSPRNIFWNARVSEVRPSTYVLQWSHCHEENKWTLLMNELRYYDIYLLKETYMLDWSEQLFNSTPEGFAPIFFVLKTHIMNSSEKNFGESLSLLTSIRTLQISLDIELKRTIPQLVKIKLRILHYRFRVNACF